MGEASLLMTVTLHAATAISTLLVFRKDVSVIMKGLIASSWNDSKDFTFKIILSMIPAAVVGIFFDDIVSSLFNQRIALVGSMLLVTGALLFFGDMARKTSKNVTYWNAFVIGISQAIAIIPGISRSGATISTSVLLGIDRYQASRFSFLMVVPLILGKMIKDMIDGGFDHVQNGAALFIGFLAAFATGFFACRLMIRLVRQSQLKYFAFYCFFVGITAIVLASKN
jgi:undecaprenyl-diphosphatase